MAETMRRRPDHCPDDEMIAEYLDDRLSQAERSWMAAHLSRCETCYFLFSEAAQTRPSAITAAAPAAVKGKTRRWPEPPFLVRSLVPGGLAAAALLAMLVGARLLPLAPSTDRQLRALVAAVGTDRTIEPRLAGGFAYGPLRGSVRSGDGIAADVSPDVQIAAAEIEKIAAGRQTPRELTALGVAHLVIGDVTGAVTTLEEAADRSPADPTILNDLAAAYLVRAARDSQAQDVAKALTITERLVAAAPRLAEGWFNRALAFEQMFLFDDARRAWQRYLTLDGSSGWAVEARRHLEQLAQKNP